MISFKNITSFSEFKKMNEAVDVGTEFGNSTGFKESLLGRATYGLFRMVKNGINAVRLEFFKRKLENEYFAGVLRYCKAKNIDLKNPQSPNDSNTNTDSITESNEIVEISNDILKVRFNVNNWSDCLNSASDSIYSGMTTIGTGTTYDDFKLLRDELIPKVRSINEKFIILSTLAAGNQPQPNDIQEILTNKTNINSLQLSSPSPQVPLHYTLIDAETNIISGLTSAVVGTAIATPLSQILVDNYNFDEDDNYLINEKVDNKSGTGLDFILGDKLSTGGVNKFLKDQGVNNVEDINFEQLSSIFTDKMRSDATSGGPAVGVNKNAIVRLSVCVSSIIYHTVKTPDNLGSNPGVGGAIDNTKQTALFQPWQKKVEKIKGEFSKFLNVDEIDPITIKTSSFAGDPKNQADINKDKEEQKEIDRIAKTIKFGTSDGFSDKKLTNFGVIRLFKDGKFTGPVFKLETANNNKKIYKYVGCLDFDKMVTDFDKIKKLDVNNKKITKVFEPVSDDGSAPKFLKLKPTGNLNGKELAGTYLIFEREISETSDGNYKEYKVRVYYLYLKSAGTMHRITQSNFIPNDFEIYYLAQNGRLEKVPDITKIGTATTISVGVGKTLEIKDPMKTNFTEEIKKVDVEFLNINGVNFQ